MKGHKQENKDIWVVISSYNEAATITTVVRQVSAIISNIVVVDDASTDQSSVILASLPVTVIRNQNNLGYLKSIERGLRYTFAHEANYAITFDADGQHQAKDLRKFVKLIHKLKPDLILGKRSFKNRLVEVFFGMYTKAIYGISDPFCGFKAYKKSFFQKMGSKLEDHYTIGLENIIFRFKNSIVRFQEVALTTAKRQDESRFAGKIYGNYLELKAVINLFWYPRVSR